MLLAIGMESAALGQTAPLPGGSSRRGSSVDLITPPEFGGFGSPFDGFSRPRSEGAELAALVSAQAELVRATAEARVNLALAAKLDVERRWTQVELAELQRRLWLLAEAETRERAKLAAIEQRAGLLNRFFAGIVTPQTAAAYEWAIAHVPHFSSVRQLLNYTVPPLPSDDFSSSLDAFRVLAPNGSLRPFPPSMGSDERFDPRGTTCQELAANWDRVRDALGRDQPVSRGQVDALRRCLTELNPAISPANELSMSVRVDRDGYVRSFRRLVDSLQLSDSGERLRWVVQHDGFGFSGGTVGDLMLHMKRFSLTARPGSAGQVQLAKCGEQFGACLADEIAARRQEIELLATRSPTRSGRTSTRPAQSRGFTSVPATAAPVDVPSFDENAEPAGPASLR